jgi:hypothetical protein
MRNKKFYLKLYSNYKELGDTISFRNYIQDSNLTASYKNGSLEVPRNVSVIWNVCDEMLTSFPQNSDTNCIWFFFCCILKEKSIVISTYALCGFANFGSVGVVIGTLSALCPSKSKIIGGLALWAMVAGSMANMLTACISGLLA